MSDWYRKHSWTAADQEDFFVRLKRAHKGTREQYLKVQAIELIQTGDDKLLDAAQSLLIKFLEDYPDDKFNRSLVLLYLGQVYERKKDISNAIS